MAGLDYGIIGLYLCLIIWMGSSFAKRQTPAYEYFLISRTVPWWAVCFTVVATETSTLTFVGIPAETYHQGAAGYSGNMTFLQLALGYVVGRFIISSLFIPRYFSKRLLTSYEVLHERFGAPVRNLGSAMFLLTRSAGDGIRLFATSFVVATIVGVPVSAAILVLGVAMIVYTFYGGAAAVIWTDVVQMFVYLAGALIVVWFAVAGVPGGFSGVVDYGVATGRFAVFDMGLDFFKAYTFWAGIVGGLTLTLATHGTDQFLVQRLLAARSQRDAQVGLSLSGILVFFQFGLFLFIGVALAAFYQTHDAPMLSRPDMIVPAFVGSQLPAGLTGLVVAAIVAAALSPSINSLAATTVNDFYLKYWNPTASDDAMMSVAKRATVAWGVVQIAIALLATQMTRSVLTAGLSVLGLGAGPVLGAFLVAATRRDASANRMASAMIAAWVVVFSVYWFTPIAWPWYAAIGAGLAYTLSWTSASRAAMAVVLLASLSGAAACSREVVSDSTLTGAIEVSVEPTRLTVVRRVVSARGTVTPVPDADWTVYAVETSTVIDLPVAEGERVAAGDIIARFEVPSRVADIQAAELEISRAVRRVETAQAQVAQLAALMDRGLVARVELDSATLDLAAAEASVATTRLALGAAQAADDRATIRARFDGVVQRRWHDQGDAVLANDSDPVIRIIDPSRVRITIDVPVQDLGHVVVGQRATVTPLAAAPLDAIVSVTPVVAPASGTAEVTLTFVQPPMPGPDGTPVPPLAVGTAVLADILIAEVPEAMVVPTDAILRLSGASYVLVVGPDQRVIRRDIRVGLATRELTQVLDGLSIGEFVITSALAELNEGDAIVMAR